MPIQAQRRPLLALTIISGAIALALKNERQDKNWRWSLHEAKSAIEEIQATILIVDPNCVALGQQLAPFLSLIILIDCEWKQAFKIKNRSEPQSKLISSKLSSKLSTYTNQDKSDDIKQQDYQFGSNGLSNSSTHSLAVQEQKSLCKFFKP
eukprot:TRINITY_DN2349_c0_g2_i4.p1 TRINITY_DN2349_c0_g2~~TRINITY_DN2349_c0_g2_i4.p1  ORF type:complete len:151 (-),score=15.59 TRINITY_DN2349_c0_g2_i4:566-1018(-)